MLLIFLLLMDHNSGRATLQYFTMPREEIYKDPSDWLVVTGRSTNSLALKVDMLLSSTSTSQARKKKQFQIEPVMMR